MYLLKEKPIQFSHAEIFNSERITLELTANFNLIDLAVGHQETRAELRLRKKILSVLKLFVGTNETMDMDDDPSNLWKVRVVVREEANSHSVSVTADGRLLEQLSRMVEEHDCFRIVVKVEQLMRVKSQQLEYRRMFYDPPPPNQINGQFGIASGSVFNFVTKELKLFDDGTPSSTKCSQSFAIDEMATSTHRQFLPDHRYTAKVTISLKSDSTKFMEFDTTDKFCFNKKSLESDLLKDFQLIGQNGVAVSCHKIILAAQSSVFEAMFQDNMKEMKEGKLELKKGDGLWNPNGRNVSEAGIRAFLAFIYYRGVASPGKDPRVCVELLELGHVYDIRPMETTMRIIMMKKSSSWFTVDAALEAHRFASKQAGTSYVDLIEKVLHVLELKSTDELNNSEVCKKLFPDSDARDMYISALKPKRDK